MGRSGYLTIQDKPYIDYTDVYDWILKVNEHHPVEKITYDRANAFRLNQELKIMGLLLKKQGRAH